ncbi:hypothetical protein JXL21_06445 [Candidatus Bathyarchaeota archaeon]|nr:hypothetical protein [Candidatus Bathyarchaeota archaeon]
MPRYTHLTASSIHNICSLGMAYCDFLLYDIMRLEDSLKRTDLCTMGAVALAGTGHRINRGRVGASRLTRYLGE